LPGWEAQQKMTGKLRPYLETIPADARQSAVLLLLFPKNKETNLLFIKRTEDGRAHSGQISFPGGRWEQTDANYQDTALREAEEEIGIKRDQIEIISKLSPLFIPVSYFQVHPFVAWCAETPGFQKNATEVAQILEVPLSQLFRKETKIKSTVVRAIQPDFKMEVPAYQPSEGTIIWGATAMMLAELETIVLGEFL